MNVTPQVWRSDDDVHVMDRRITLSLIGMDINASGMTEILVTSSFPTAIIHHEEVAEIVNLMDSYIVTEPNFCILKEEKKPPQPLTLAPPSAAATELQVISHASLLWAWEFSLAQWTKLNSAGLDSFVTLWVAGFVWPFSRPSAYTSSRFGWTELRHSGWEITLSGGVRGAAY